MFNAEFYIGSAAFGSNYKNRRKIMAKLQQVLNEEIRRMSRKEVSGLLKALRTQISGLRDLVKELNGRVKALEKFHPKAESGAVEALGNQSEAKTVRVTAERIRKWRKKLGLSQAQFATLIGVNAISVNHWETGKTVPRPAQKQKIASLRDAGSRQIAQLLAANHIEIKKKAGKKAAPKKAAPKKAAVPKKAAAEAKPAKAEVKA